MMMNLRDKSDASGGKTYLFAMVFNLAVQIVFSLALSAIMIYGGYSSAEEVPYYPTINLLAMMALQGAFLAAILFVRPRLLAFGPKRRLPHGRRTLRLQWRPRRCVLPAFRGWASGLLCCSTRWGTSCLRLQ